MKKAFIFLIIFISLVYLYGKYIEPDSFKVKEYAITNERIPESFDGYKIIHFTDLYYNGDKLDKIVNRINELNTDLIVFTGNLLSSDIDKDSLDKLTSYLNQIDSKYGIYAVKGSNDNSENYDYILENTNINLLENNYIYLYNEEITPIMLIGLDNNIDIEKTFNYIDNEYYKIVLSHKPDNFDLISTYKPDLFLSGTSLNGQVRLPLIGALYKFDGAKKYYDPIYTIDNSIIYISNGLGNPKYNFRLFNTPSINFYRLYNK